MAYEFKRLSDVEALTEVPENATVLAEVEGSIKRVPSNGLGGSGGIKTAIIKDSEYNNALAGVMSAASVATTYECINMTFEEAYETMASGEPLVVYLMLAGDYIINIQASVYFVGIAAFGVPCIVVGTTDIITLFWTADGISIEEPSMPK